MPRTASALALLLIALLCLCLDDPLALAQSNPAPTQNIPTREHQLLSPCDYIPLKRQAAGPGFGEQPVVIGTINGQTAMFMVDTGTSICILSPEIIKQFGLKTGPAFMDNGKPDLWKGKQLTTASVFGFKVSNVTNSKVPFRVLPDQDFMLDPKAPDDTRFDGVVGANLLEHFAVLMDASQHQFGLCLPGNLYLKQVADYGLTRPYTVPIIKKRMDFGILRRKLPTMT